MEAINKDLFDIIKKIENVLEVIKENPQKELNSHCFQLWCLQRCIESSIITLSNNVDIANGITKKTISF